MREADLLILWDIFRETMWSYCIPEQSTAGKEGEEDFICHLLSAVGKGLTSWSFNFPMLLGRMAGGWANHSKSHASVTTGKPWSRNWEACSTGNQANDVCLAGPPTAWRTRSSHCNWNSNKLFQPVSEAVVFILGVASTGSSIASFQ